MLGVCWGGFGGGVGVVESILGLVCVCVYVFVCVCVCVCMYVCNVFSLPVF